MIKNDGINITFLGLKRLSCIFASSYLFKEAQTCSLLGNIKAHHSKSIYDKYPRNLFRSFILPVKGTPSYLPFHFFLQSHILSTDLLTLQVHWSILRPLVCIFYTCKGRSAKFKSDFILEDLNCIAQQRLGFHYSSYLYLHRNCESRIKKMYTKNYR